MEHQTSISDIQNLKQRLKDIITRKSFSRGSEFQLASGRSSNFYFNMKPSMLDAEGATLIGELILTELTRRYIKPDYVGGLELGAVPIVTLVAATSYEYENSIPAFVVRKAIKGHGTMQRIEGLEKDETLKGKKILIVEDVTTTGGSSMQVVDIVRKEGAEVALLLTLVDRQEGAEQTFVNANVPFASLFKASDFDH